MTGSKTRWWGALVLWLLGMVLASDARTAEYVSGKVWPEPKVVDPGCATKAPSDAIVLFDGKDLSKWNGGEQWIVKDGTATPDKGGITTKQAFGSCQLHVEFATPEKVEGTGQGRGNSGVYLMSFCCGSDFGVVGGRPGLNKKGTSLSFG